MPKAAPALPRKPRGDAKLKNLSLARRRRLFEYVNGSEGEPGTTLKEGVAFVKKNFKMHTTLDAMSQFISWYRDQDKIQRALARGEIALKQIEERGPEAFDGIADAMRNWAEVMFMSEAIEHEDPKTFVQIAKLTAEFRAIRQNERRIKLLEEKAVILDRARHTLRSSDLTPEERLAKLQRILRLDARQDMTPRPQAAAKSAKKKAAKKAAKKKAAKKAAKKKGRPVRAIQTQ